MYFLLYSLESLSEAESYCRFPRIVGDRGFRIDDIIIPCIALTLEAVILEGAHPPGSG